MKRALLPTAGDRPKKPRVWEWTAAPPAQPAQPPLLPSCATTKPKPALAPTPLPQTTTTPPAPTPAPAPALPTPPPTLALTPGSTRPKAGAKAKRGALDHLAYPHLFEAVLRAVIERRDAASLRALRGTSRAVAARIDAAFLADVSYALAPAEPAGPLKLAPLRPLPPHSRLLGLPWAGQPVAVATVEVGPCECHARFTPADADEAGDEAGAGVAGAEIDLGAEAEADTEAGGNGEGDADSGVGEMDLDADDEAAAGDEGAEDEAEAEAAEAEPACPAHAHEGRVRADNLGRLEYVRFVGDPHAHSAAWALEADTEIHVLDMFPRKHNGWTRMNRATLDSRRVSLQVAGGAAGAPASPAPELSELSALAPAPAPGSSPGAMCSPGTLGSLRSLPPCAPRSAPRRRILNFRLHADYEWLFDYCMLPASDVAHTTVLVSRFRGAAQLEAPEDECLLCFEASGCRTDPSRLIHVKPDAARRLSPAEGPLFGLVTSLADDWTGRLRDLLRTPYPPPMNAHTAGTLTIVGAETWENRWIQSRPNDVLLPSGYAREKIRQCFYWRCLSNVQDAILGRLTDEVDYTTRNPRIKRWWEFVYLFINEESCFRFLSLDEYAREAGERELELVLAEDV